MWTSPLWSPPVALSPAEQKVAARAAPRQKLFVCSRSPPCHSRGVNDYPPFITRSSAMARPEPVRPPIATPAGAESLLATGLWGLGARGRVARRSSVATAPVIDPHGRGLRLPTGRGLTGDGLGRWKARVRLLHLLTG